MENLYKLDEFTGELPNPKGFPIRGGNIYAIKGRPYTFADGFMVDLTVKEKDKGILEGKVVRTFDTSYFDGYIMEEKKSKLLLSEPEFVSDITYLAYVVFTPSGNPVAIQVKYYKYFRNRYPECKFYVYEEEAAYRMVKPIVIKVNEEVVGLCMPISHSEEILTKIKEERK